MSDLSGAGARRAVGRLLAAYSALGTDHYPPFRLDLGGAEPGVAAAAEPPVPVPQTGW